MGRRDYNKKKGSLPRLYDVGTNTENANPFRNNIPAVSYYDLLGIDTDFFGDTDIAGNKKMYIKLEPNLNLTEERVNELNDAARDSYNYVYNQHAYYKNPDPHRKKVLQNVTRQGNINGIKIKGSEREGIGAYYIRDIPEANTLNKREIGARIDDIERLKNTRKVYSALGHPLNVDEYFKSRLIHEITHAGNNGGTDMNNMTSDWYDYDIYRDNNVQPDGYWDIPTEIASRVMEARYNLGIPSYQKITEAYLNRPDVKDILEEFVLDRYTDDFLLYLFNNEKGSHIGSMAEDIRTKIDWETELSLEEGRSKYGIVPTKKEIEKFREVRKAVEAMKERQKKAKERRGFKVE
jgi:hypothetical protein